MAAQKRKSTVVELSVKQRKLEKSNKPTHSANKEKHVLTPRHDSSKSKPNNCKIQKKKLLKTLVKPDRLANSKATSNCGKSSSQIKFAKKPSSQSKGELKKVPIKTVPIKKSTLRPPNKVKSPKTSLCLSKLNHNNPPGSTKAPFRNTPGKTEKSNLKQTNVFVENTHLVKLQSDDNHSPENQSGHNTKHFPSIPINRAAPRNTQSAMKSVKEKSKENNSVTSAKVIASDDMAKRLASKGAEKPLLKSSSDRKANEPEPRTRMTTRSENANSNNKKSKHLDKNSVAIKKLAQLDSPPQKELSQKKPAQEIPRSKRATPTPLNEQLNRRSQRLQQLMGASTRSLRNREIKGPAVELKQNTPTKRAERSSKAELVKLSKPKGEQKNVKRKVSNVTSDSPEKNDVSAVEETTSSPKGKKRKVDQRIDDASLSQKSTQQPAKKEMHSGPMVSSQVKKAEAVNSLTPKRIEKLSVKQAGRSNSVKLKKNSHPVAPDENVDDNPENAVKSKRVSILELCEEIAGEIESDTVEVKREASIPEGGKEEEKPSKILPAVEGQLLSQKEPSTNVQCKRFFPSRKAVPVKCTLNGISSPVNKNSKWTKIKLAKANHVHQACPDSSAAPKLDTRTNSNVSQATVRLSPDTQRLKMPNKLPAAKPHEEKCAVSKQGKSNDEIPFEEVKSNATTTVTKKSTERIGQVDNQTKQPLEPTSDESCSLRLEASPESTPARNLVAAAAAAAAAAEMPPVPPQPNQIKTAKEDNESPGSAPRQLVRTLFSNQTPKTSDRRVALPNQPLTVKSSSLSEIKIPKDLKLKEAEKDDDKQLIIDAGQKRFGAISCAVCGMLYTASNPEDETQHLLFHNQFISAVKYVVLLINHHECGSEEELITSIFLSMFNFRYTQRSLLPH
ncbi:N-acetyltransferase ESCO1 isoform X2 [Ornithorhynchus anatinus]|uniref:Establishment of sister chromatid cohesion N-acetyltransferase 1 n=1 Tax=Ornithorhynchus anatinus TaxID=9258 RepID=A0A6I8NDM1_ORNAN|nr:N-acetyltransferase ESCO1 isoform X2 [Ornithorhynchus anatinus]